MLLAALAIFLGFVGVLEHPGFSYIISLLVLGISCYLSNYVFAKLFKAPINKESWLITALILFFIMFPGTLLSDMVTSAFAGVIAMASKYFLTINKRHIFNPAAFGVFAISLVGIFESVIPHIDSYFNTGNVVWWVATPVMLPFVLVFGLLVVRKIRKFSMFFGFIIAALVMMIVFEPQSIILNLLSAPLVFFGTIMLTEPFTLPTKRRMQVLYAVLVGILFMSRFHIGTVYSSPELALVIGNIFSFTFSLKRRLVLTLDKRTEIAKDTLEFSFIPDVLPRYEPGQYFEWTLPHSKDDNRGNRRYFTIASSPTEKDIKLGIKFYNPPSTFKKELVTMKKGYFIVTGQLLGDFVLPKDKSKKLVFIAGGIGVTPFRSMVKYLIDKGERRNIILIYSVKNEDEIAYRDIFTEAESKVGLRNNYLVGSFLSEEVIQKDIPDFSERMFYLSGPNAMVENYKKLLLSMGIRHDHIKTDYFPGF
jgi:ferredoxin-NADP reductase